MQAHNTSAPHTQAKIAASLGVTQQAVAKWFGKDGTNTTSCNTSAPDARVKVPPKARLGELLAGIPDKKASSGKGTRSLPPAITKKESHYAQEPKKKRRLRRLLFGLRPSNLFFFGSRLLRLNHFPGACHFQH
jgi:hypothetical protein